MVMQVVGRYLVNVICYIYGSNIVKVEMIMTMLLLLLLMIIIITSCAGGVIVILKLVLCNIVGYIIYVVISLPVI